MARDWSKVGSTKYPLIGTTCTKCKKGTMKKKHNRKVKPAKPFIGCSNWPRCDHSVEMDGSAAKPVSASGRKVPVDHDLYCWSCFETYSSNDGLDTCTCGAGLVYIDDGLVDYDVW